MKVVHLLIRRYFIGHSAPPLSATNCHISILIRGFGGKQITRKYPPKFNSKSGELDLPVTYSGTCIVPKGDRRQYNYYY